MNVEIANYMRTLNLDEVCRTCLSECDEMTSLFSEVDPSDEDDDITLFVYQILMNVSSIQILMNDGLPTLVCKTCIESAQNAFKFKVLCERSEALLQSYVSNNIRVKEEIKYEKGNDFDDQVCFETLDAPIEFGKKCTTFKNISRENETDNNNESNSTDSHDISVNVINEEIVESSTMKHSEGLIKLEPGTISNNGICMSSQSKNTKISLAKSDVQAQIDLLMKTHNEKVYKSKKEIYQNDESTTQSVIQEVVINPDIPVDDSDASNSSEFTDASVVASTEANILLRERIKLKKMYSAISSTNKNNLPRKKKNFHQFRLNDKGEKIYSCPHCNKEYKHSTSLTVHIRTHTMERPYLCTLCGKGFKQFTGLNYHMRGHNNEQPYACSLCDKRYRQAGSLTAHMRIHTGQRPFLCSICGKGFRQAPDLGYHMRTHTKEKPYMCSVCGKRMSMQCHLTQHMRIHSGEKPFSCKECGKAFASTTRLKRHEIIHTGLKPFVCDVCSKAFNRSSTLRVHAMTHTDERPHVCKACGKGFIQAHCLRSHLKTHYSDIIISSVIMN